MMVTIDFVQPQCHVVFQSGWLYSDDTELWSSLVHQSWPVLRGCFFTHLHKVTTFGSMAFFNNTSLCYGCV